MKLKEVGQGAVRRLSKVPSSCTIGLLIGLALSGCATNSSPQLSSQSGVRIGMIDPQRVLNETEAGQKAKEELTTFTDNRRALVELEEKELKRMEEDLLKQASVLSANAKRGREERFRRRMIEYQQKVNEMNREVQVKQKEVLEKFRSKVAEVVAKVARENGLLVVIEKGLGSPTVYSDSSLDITAQVITELNRRAR